MDIEQIDRWRAQFQQQSRVEIRASRTTTALILGVTIIMAVASFWLVPGP